jgi:hypothetical protein
MRCIWKTLRVPKKGNSFEEYEDACAGDVGKARFAVADGASESAFAGLWAKLLVEHYVEHPIRSRKDFDDWLAEPRCQWAETVDQLEQPWYLESKVRQGAFATFLGVQIEKEESNGCWRWVALAVGDSCIVQVRDGVIVRSFPLSKPEEFGNQPQLVGSRNGAALADRAAKARAEWKPGDQLLLMTDALAHWCLGSGSKGKSPCQRLCDFLATKPDAREFAAWIDDLRERGELNNDDVTLGVLLWKDG